MSRVLLEVCVDDADGMEAAIAGGADRIELCSILELGGLTPSPGLVALAARSPLPVRAMIRPRPGDFVYSPAEIDTMLADIAAMRAAGLSGVVLGASLPDGRLDVALLTRLAEAAHGMGRTLHRAFDLVPDFAAATEMAVQMGFDTILTSGGAETALAGIDVLAGISAQAAGRVTIMPGSGVSADTPAGLRSRMSLTAIHGACALPAAPASPPAMRLGFTSPSRRRTSTEKVAALRGALDN